MRRTLTMIPRLVRAVSSSMPCAAPPRVVVVSSVPGLPDLLNAAIGGARSAGPVPCSFEFTSSSSSDAAAKLANADVVLGDPKAAGPLLQHAPRMRWFQSTFAGVEHVFKHLPRRDFIFSRMGVGMAEGIAEWAVLCLLAHTRQFGTVLQRQREGVWAHDECGDYRLLHGKTVGILGAGTIGNHVAKVLSAFGMKSIGYKRSTSARSACDVDSTDLNFVLSNSHAIVNVLPSTPDTRDLLSGEKLKVCAEKRPVLLNAGRGDVINESSILSALQHKWLAAAYLDVFAVEPLPQDSKLWTAPGVTITPHVAAVSFADDVVRVFMENLQILSATGVFASPTLSAAQQRAGMAAVRFPVNFDAQY